MNREIKFRGKRKDNNEWVFGFIYEHEPPLQCFAKEKSKTTDFAILKPGFADWNLQRPIDQFEVDGNTVSQFIGLKDKNGKDIYEFDIVKSGDYLMLVNWNEKFASFCLDKDGWAYSHWFGESCNPQDVEIVGNLFENPELIKANV